MTEIAANTIERIVVRDAQREVVTTTDLDRVVVREVDNRAVVVTGPDVRIITASGGPPGPQGPQGPPGLPGSVEGGLQMLERVYGVADVTWEWEHGLGTYALEVNCFELDGMTEKDCQPTLVDANTLRLDWFYPETGVVRVLH